MHILRNILALLLNQVGTWMVTLVLTLVLPRYLGPANYGVFSFAGAFAGFFALGMRLGAGAYLTWRVAREPQIASRLMFNTLLVQIPLVLACGVAALAILPTIESRAVVVQIVAIVLLASAIDSLTGTFVATLNGFQIMRIPALVSLLCSALGAGLIVAGTHMRIDLISLALINLLTSLLYFAILLVYTRRKVPFTLSVDPTLWRVILLGGMPFFVWSVVLVLYGQIDVTILKILVGDTVVGWYAAANRLVTIPLFLPTIVIGVMLPALSAERSADSPRFRELASRSLRIVFLVSAPASVGLIALTDQLFALVRYPASFAPAGPLLRILALSIPLLTLDMVLGTILIAMGRQKAWTMVGLVAAAFNPLANLWAIPFTLRTFGNGAIGAAIVTGLTELVMFGGALYLRPRGVFTRGDISYMLRVVLATLVMTPAVWLMAHATPVSVFAAVGYGAVIYAAAIYSLRLISDSEVVALWRAVATRARGSPHPAGANDALPAGAAAVYPARSASEKLLHRLKSWQSAGIRARQLRSFVLERRAYPLRLLSRTPDPGRKSA